MTEIEQLRVELRKTYDELIKKDEWHPLKVIAFAHHRTITPKEYRRYGIEPNTPVVITSEGFNEDSSFFAMLDTRGEILSAYGVPGEKGFLTFSDYPLTKETKNRIYEYLGYYQCDNCLIEFTALPKIKRTAGGGISHKCPRCGVKTTHNFKSFGRVLIADTLTKENIMRELEPTNEHTKIIVVDSPGAGGACHKYKVVSKEEPGIPSAVYAEISFQKGAIKEAGVNGCTMEDLLAIVMDRLESFQAGSFPCKENHRALEAVHDALYWLKVRTVFRQDQKIEGTYKPHDYFRRNTGK